MMLASTARLYTNTSARSKEKDRILAKITPIIDTLIRDRANNGYNEAIFQTKEIRNVFSIEESLCLTFSMKEIIELIVETLHVFEYKTWVTDSRSSIHIKW